MFHSRCSVIFGFGLLCLAVSLGCNDPMVSTASEAVTMPASPTTIPVGPSLTYILPSSGPTTGGDSLRLIGYGFETGARVTLGGTGATVTKMSAAIIDVRTAGHPAGAVDVVVTNPDGQAATLKGVYTFGVFAVTGSPEVVGPGGELTVTWIAPAGRGCGGGGDWIAIYPVGAPDQTGAANGHSDLWYDHVCGRTSGTWRLNAPDEPGQYEFRFMLGDSSTARSNSITVR